MTLASPACATVLVAVTFKKSSLRDSVNNVVSPRVSWVCQCQRPRPRQAADHVELRSLIFGLCTCFFGQFLTIATDRGLQFLYTRFWRPKS